MVLSSLVAAAIPLALTVRGAAGGPDDAAGHQNERGGAPGQVNVNETVARYISAWNERDPARRRILVAAAWTEDGSYVDAHRHGAGHEAIDAMLAAAQARFPGYRLRLISGIEAHNSFARFKWAAGGTEEAPLYLGGTDFAVLAPDGRIRTIAGFTDAAPAPVK
jgi:hypothetical protein